MSQYGGPGRPTGSGDFGTGGSGGGDDDRYTSPFSEQGGQDPYDDDRPPFGYQEDERYWTDYLRIAAPVVGVILMLGLVWFWVANMLNGDDEDFDNNGDDPSGPVIDSETPEATEEEEDAGDEPVAVTTPEGEEGDGDANGEEGEEEEESPTTLSPGATAVVVGTGEEGLNVRESASTEAEVVNSIADGTEITITGESEQADGFTWWPIDTGEITGYVADDFIELSE